MYEYQRSALRFAAVALILLAIVIVGLANWALHVPSSFECEDTLVSSVCST